MTSFKVLVVLLFLVFVLTPEDFGANAWRRRRRRRRSPPPVGVQGPRGPRGFRGLTGSRGFTGLRGPRGHRGLKGLRGFRGFTGRRGARGMRGFRGLPGRPAPLQKISCAPYTSHPNIKYSSFVRCPFLGQQIVSCSCRSSRRKCSKRHTISGNICRCACKRARPTAVCCRLARVYRRKG